MTAGWYPDPAGTDALRWWDGGAWTTQLRPNQPASESVGVGSWILPSPGSGPGSEYSPAAIAAPAQPLAITATVAPYAETQPADYGQPAAQPDYYAQYAAQPDPFIELGLAPGYAEPTSIGPAAGPTRSAQTVGIWLLAIYPLLVIPLALLAQSGAEWALTQLDLPVPGLAFIGVPTAIVVGWIFAGADVGRLRKSGYRPPSILWMLLLPPLGYFIARSVALRRDRGKTWPAGIVFGISIAALSAVVVIMISVVMAFLAALGLLPAVTDPDDAAADTDQDPRTTYGIGFIAEQDVVLGPLPESSDPYQLRVENIIEAWYLYPDDGSVGDIDCSASIDIIDVVSTFPCVVVDLDTSDGFDDSGTISVTLDVDGSLSYSELGKDLPAWLRPTIRAGALPNTGEPFDVRAAAVVATSLGFDGDPARGTVDCSQNQVIDYDATLMCEVTDLEPSDGTLPHRLSLLVRPDGSVIYNVWEDEA
jgi:hypothetical protein